MYIPLFFPSFIYIYFYIKDRDPRDPEDINHLPTEED
jgi:hypothetical protein